jgi:hypothetical protein
VTGLVGGLRARSADMDGCVVMVGQAGDRADVDDLRG